MQAKELRAWRALKRVNALVLESNGASKKEKKRKGGGKS